MKRIQKFALTMTLILVAGIFVFAQRPMHRHGQLANFDKMLEHMTQELELSENQIAEITKLHEDFAIKFKEARTAEEPGANREAMQSLRKEMTDDMKKILTEEQVEKWEQIRPKGVYGKRGHGSHSKEEAQERKANRKEMHEEMKAYRAEHIQPVMLQQRLKLEEELNAEEKELVQSTRDELAVIKKQKQQETGNNAIQRQKRGGKGMANRSGDTGRRNGIRRAKAGAGGPGAHRIAGVLEKTSPESYEKMTDLAEKYTSEIAELWMEIEDEHQEWRSDMQEIRAKYLPEGALEKRNQAREGKGKRAQFEKPDTEREALNKKIAFLLMPIEEEAAVDGTIEGLQAKVFPNPARSWNALTLDLNEKTFVQIDLIDESGNLVKEIQSKKLSKGEHKFDVDLSGLTGTTYYYRIQAGDQISTVRFIKLEE